MPLGWPENPLPGSSTFVDLGIVRVLDLLFVHKAQEVVVDKVNPSIALPGGAAWSYCSLSLSRC
jgi:hypothetical protein